LRTLNIVFGADPYNLVESVVFNGVVEDVGEITKRTVRHCVLTLCAPRPKFRKLNLEDIGDAVEVIRKHFGARMSAHPEDFDDVPALRPFSLADPDAVIELTEDTHDDPRPDLLRLGPTALERFLGDLLDRMGLDVQRITRTEADDLVCIATDPTPVVGGPVVALVKFGHEVITPSAVRHLHHVVHRESASKGMLFASGRFQPGAFAAARGKPLELYDGPSVLALCHQHHVPARLGRIATLTTEATPPPAIVPTQRQPSGELEPTTPDPA